MNIDISEDRKEMIDMARELVSIVKEKMIEYYAGDSRRVHHFLKVHSFAKLIAEIENMDPGEQEVLEIAALTHDIGIKNAELKYGYNNGRLQEQEVTTGGKTSTERRRS